MQNHAEPSNIFSHYILYVDGARDMTGISHQQPYLLKTFPRNRTPSFEGIHLGTIYQDMYKMRVDCAVQQCFVLTMEIFPRAATIWFIATTISWALALATSNKTNKWPMCRLFQCLKHEPLSLYVLIHKLYCLSQPIDRQIIHIYIYAVTTNFCHFFPRQNSN